MRGDPRVRRPGRQRARDVRQSLYDETGRRRANFGLADVFGVSFGGRIDGPMQNSYLNLDADPATGRRHPILDGLEDTPRIINGVFRVAGRRRQSAFPSPLTLMPTYPDLPMEDVYPRVAAHRHARAVSARSRPRAASSTSRGTSTARSGKCMCVDHGRLLRNAVAWARNEPPPVEVDGPGVIDVRSGASATR